VARRERLFSLVAERCQHHPLVWVAGPPGAGKTTLIASYLTEHKPRSLWYHLDPGDADVAAFFHYLAQAGQAAAGRRRLRVPALTAEFLADVPGYTRRFMRELWSKVPLPAVLVLDDYHDLPTEAGLHALLPVALAEFPPGATLIAISRNDPPSQLAREVTHNKVGHIGWEDLRLTFEETQAIASSVPGVDQDRLQTLHAQANGWAAGTMLMLERYQANEAWTAPQPADARAGVFPYFAAQVFVNMDARTQEVLLRTALLPWITEAMAAEVSGHTGAGHVLRELYRRGLFVDRRADTQVAYQYHDLFREFLLEQYPVHFEGETLTNLKRIAAGVAERSGQKETAIALYAEIQAWDDLSRVICAMSETWLAQGRYQTLQSSIARLPPNERDQRPWLLYWSGMSRLVFDPLGARADLEAAYRQFERTDQDLAGLLLSASGVIESYYCAVDEMAPTIPWGDQLHRLLAQHQGFPSVAIQARVMMNLLGLIFACPHHPLLQELERDVDRILPVLDDPASRLGVAAVFLYLPMWRGELHSIRQLLDELTPSLQGSALPPRSLVIWRVIEGNYAWNTSNWEQSREKFQEALSVIETYGIHVFKPMVWGVQTHAALAAGDDQEAERLADCARTVTHGHQRLGLGQSSYYRGGIALMSGDHHSARDHASRALDTMIPLGLPTFTSICRVGLAKILAEVGETAMAREQLHLALESARLTGSRMIEAHCHITMAQVLIKDGQVQEAEASLREGLRIARALDCLTLDYWWRPKVMTELFAHALEAGIEVDFVRSVIRRRGLRAPARPSEQWPYPVTIHTLGHFGATIQDVALSFSGKTQRKPLELLKYLSASGAQGAHQDSIEEVLWPEADGEAAGQAFRTTLHRLRKLLRLDEAVQCSDRYVVLDPSLVAMDHIAFEQTTQHVDRTDAAALERVLGLYRGHFLQGESAPWVLPVRERLRARFLDLTERLGMLLEERGEAGDAAQTYLRALDVEPVAEGMCRRVMLIYGKLGRRAEAVGVYQRFSHALQTKLGVPPASETIELYHRIAKA
jgi:LuxR family maltose regulon positive regulatory protein